MWFEMIRVNEWKGDSIQLTNIPSQKAQEKILIFNESMGLHVKELTTWSWGSYPTAADPSLHGQE